MSALRNLMILVIAEAVLCPLLPLPSTAGDSATTVVATRSPGRESPTGSGAEREVPIRTIFPVESWSYMVSDEGGTLPLVGTVSRVIQSGDDMLYLLDSQLSSVLEFSIAGGYRGVYCPSGDGPGEISQAIDIAPAVAGKIAVARQMPGEILLPNGRGGHEKKTVRLNSDGVIGFVTLDRLWRLADGFVVRGSSVEVVGGTQSACAFLSITNDEGVERRNLLRRCTTLENLSKGSGLKGLSEVSQAIVACDGKRLYMVEDPNKYVIKVCDSDGGLLYTIQREIARRRYSEAEREQIGAIYAEMRGKVPHAASLFTEEPPVFAPSVLSLVPREDGQLWVLPDRDGDAGAGIPHLLYDVFDENGELIEGLRIVLDEFLGGDGLYVLENCLVSLRGLMNTLGDSNADNGKSEEIRITCYRFE